MPASYRTWPRPLETTNQLSIPLTTDQSVPGLGDVPASYRARVAPPPEKRPISCGDLRTDQSAAGLGDVPASCARDLVTQQWTLRPSPGIAHVAVGNGLGAPLGGFGCCYSRPWPPAPSRARASLQVADGGAQMGPSRAAIRTRPRNLWAGPSESLIPGFNERVGRGLEAPGRS